MSAYEKNILGAILVTIFALEVVGALLFLVP